MDIVIQQGPYVIYPDEQGRLAECNIGNVHPVLQDQETIPAAWETLKVWPPIAAMHDPANPGTLPITVKCWRFVWKPQRIALENIEVVILRLHAVYDPDGKERNMVRRFSQGPAITITRAEYEHFMEMNQ